MLLASVTLFFISHELLYYAQDRNEDLTLQIEMRTPIEVCHLLTLF